MYAQWRCKDASQENALNVIALFEHYRFQSAQPTELKYLESTKSLEYNDKHKRAITNSTRPMPL